MVSRCNRIRCGGAKGPDQGGAIARPNSHINAPGLGADITNIGGYVPHDGQENPARHKAKQTKPPKQPPNQAENKPPHPGKKTKVLGDVFGDFLRGLLCFRAMGVFDAANRCRKGGIVQFILNI